MNRDEMVVPLSFIDAVNDLAAHERLRLLLRQAEVEVFSATQQPNQIEIMHPDRWEKALGLPPGRLSALLVTAEEAAYGGARGGGKFDEMVLLPPKKTHARSKAERKSRRAKRKQRRR